MPSLAYPIKIFVSHSDQLVQAGLVAAIGADARFAALEISAREVSARMRCDGRVPLGIFVTDYERGITLLESLEADRRRGDLNVVIVTNRDREAEVQRALSMGARGYLMPGCSFDDLSDALVAVNAGRVHLCQVASQRMADGLFHDRLTSREVQVLHSLALGHANKEIARDLQVSVGTVKSHMRALMAKLHVSSRTQAVLAAEHRGLLPVVSKERANASRPQVAAPGTPAGEAFRAVDAHQFRLHTAVA